MDYEKFKKDALANDGDIDSDKVYEIIRTIYSNMRMREGTLPPWHEQSEEIIGLMVRSFIVGMMLEAQKAFKAATTEGLN